MINDINPMREDLLATQNPAASKVAIPVQGRSLVKARSTAFNLGYLEQSLAHIGRELVAAELADPEAVWAIQALINKKIEKAREAERAYSIG